MEKTLLEIGYQKLSKLQRKIYEECLQKESGGLSLPMGSGKTIISICVGLKQNNDPILVVASKTLVASWITEIEKFFGDELKYEVVSPSHTKKINQWKMDTNTNLVLVTPTILARKYTQFSLASNVIQIVTLNGNSQHSYITVQEPPMRAATGVESIFSIRWGTLIIDEAQEYSNIKSNICRSLCAISAKHRWALSGTLITNPKPERILGYYCLIDYPCPRTLNEIQRYTSTANYGGIKESTIMRDKRSVKINVTTVDKIISHSMSHQEQQVYLMFKNMVLGINKRIRELKSRRVRHEDALQIRRLSTSLLTTITYLRQSIVNPILPISSIMLQMTDYKLKNELAIIMNGEINKLNIRGWLNSENSILSSRIKAVLKELGKHQNDRVVMFVSHRTSVLIFEHFISDRPFFTISMDMNISKRKDSITEFENTKNGVLVLTYAIGSMGLNLQKSHICFIVDLEWSAHIARQAVARLVRRGQKSKEVYVYYFTSNTGIEAGVLNKQVQKDKVVNSITNGPTDIEIKSTNMREYVSQLITIEDNIKILDELYID